MAEYISDPPQLLLSHEERRQLISRFEEQEVAWAESRFALLPPVPGYSPAPSTVRRSQPEAGRKPPGKMIVGPTNGFVAEDPPFDDSNLISLFQGDVLGGSYAGRTPTGELLVQLSTGLGPQIDGFANAAIITFALPSANGQLQFYPGANWNLLQSVRGVTLGGASAAGALHIRSGISVITLQPFHADPITDIADIYPPIEFQIGQDSFYPGPNPFNANQSQFASPQPHPSGFSHVATLPHVYACFTWVTAAVSTRGNAGVWIDVSLNLPSFQFEVP